MANRERGEVAVKVDGKEYTLRPTFDSLCEFEALTGKAPDEFFDAIMRGTFTGLRASVWCLLQDDHSDEIKTLKDASRWIERAGGIDVVSAYLAQLRDLNSDEAGEAEAKANPPDAQVGTGAPSSSALSTSA